MKIVRILAAGLALVSSASAQSAGPANPHRVAPAPNPVAAAPASTARPIMGVTMESLDEALAEQLGIETDAAVLIEEVMPGYGAAKAGMKKHDVVTKLDGKGPVSTEGVRKALGKKKVGDHVAVTVIRGRETKELDVELIAASDASAGGLAGPGSTSGSEFGSGRGPVTGQHSPVARAGSENRAGAADEGPAAQAYDNARSLFGQTLQRRESDEQSRALIVKLRTQLRDAESEIAKRAHEVARESSKMAEEFAKQARGKFEASTAEDRMRKLVELSREHSERTRERLETDLRETLERQREQLERSMTTLEKSLAKLHSSDLTWTRNPAASQQVATAPQPGRDPLVKAPPVPSVPPVLPVAPPPYTTFDPATPVKPRNPGGVSAGAIPPGAASAQVPGLSPGYYAVLGDNGAKALKKVEERLSEIEERLQHIDEMVEKLLARSATKNPK